ncbi:5405_t:CDS:2 [Racocetra persica]|uniref:5405_t:CDS:1 n=2 Tax=Racocetra persica TaxID=160502 RepID=A0ACA9KA84_9GLOM|nr:5404_t:CDS:2 [Racocetra persica]CAG8461990.1 5405_t:CDS:2 [Racocetra persica]
MDKDDTKSSESEMQTSDYIQTEKIRKPQPSDFAEIMKNLSIDDFKNVGKMACFRGSLLNGIGGGATIGALRYMLKGSILSASNWAVGSFFLISMGSWEYCRRKRRLQHESMLVVVQKLNELKRKKTQEKAAENAEKIDSVTT